MITDSNGILITGATGFLGAYILKELMEQTQLTIYCLARSSNNKSATLRLNENLEFLFDESVLNSWKMDRIVVLEGDMGRERFGLSNEDYVQLSENVRHIFHSAAMMWHFGKVEVFQEVNVCGVGRLLEFCDCGVPKELNHISTLAVSGRRCDNPNNEFCEADFHENMECPNAYVQTKYEAEQVLRPAMLEGRGVRIFRPGFIMGDMTSGRFKKTITTDAQYLHLRGHVLMQTAPPLYDDDFMDVTPVDYAAAAIVHIALSPDTENQIFHVCNPEPVLKARVWDLISEYGYFVRNLPAETYMLDVMELDDSDEFLEGLKDVIVYLGDYEKSPAVFRCDSTLRALEGSGITCHAPDRELLHKYLDYCVDIGFLPAPANQ